MFSDVLTSNHIKHTYTKHKKNNEKFQVKGTNDHYLRKIFSLLNPKKIYIFLCDDDDE